jgi:hypothetical protein
MTHLSLSELFPHTFLNESTLHKSLGEEFSLCENGNMVFHWTDFHETCDVVKKHLESHPEMKEEFIRKEQALNRLSLIPVWIRTEKKVHQTTMFELYERYILNQMQLSMGVDPFGPIEISFISSTGPFKSLAIAECFNKNTYKDFVMVYLLQDKLPKRDFRVRLKAKVLMEYGQEFGKAQLIQLEQLTMNGLLLSMESELFLKEISKESSLRFLIDSECLKEGTQKNLDDLKTYLSQYAFNLMYSSRKEDALCCEVKDINLQSSFDFLKNRKVFLFVPYEHLKAQDSTKLKSIVDFVNHTRILIREHYQNIFLKKIA